LIVSEKTVARTAMDDTGAEERQTLSGRAQRLPGERLTVGVNCLSWDCGTSNLAYCLIESVDEPDREFCVRLWENFSLGSDTTAEAVFALRRELDARPWMRHADHVCIEAQANVNPTMKVISHALQMYFICRTDPGTVAARAAAAPVAAGVEVRPAAQCVPVHFISPKNKFKVCSVPEPEGQKGHAKNKMVAVLMAKKVLAGPRDKPMYDYLMSHKKKDDLSDCFLQGLYFLRLLRQKNRSARRIMEHIKGTISIVDETEERHDRPAQRVYRGDNYSVPEFDIDGSAVPTSARFSRKNIDSQQKSEGAGGAEADSHDGGDGNDGGGVGSGRAAPGAAARR
jgi:hypothetical protein